MAYPPPILPVNRANDTLQADLHPTDHNQAAQAINDISAQMQATGLLGWSPVDVPGASGIVGPHHYIELVFVTTLANLAVEIRSSIGVGWETASTVTPTDIIGLDIWLDGADIGVKSYVSIPFATTVGFHNVELSHIATIGAPGTHWVTCRVWRHTGASTVGISPAGYAAAWGHGVIAPSTLTRE